MLQTRRESASSLRPDDVVESALLANVSGVRHAFFTRLGGVSTGLYSGLNAGFGSGDDREAVAENRRRAARFLVEADDVVGPYQIHSPRVFTAVGPFAGERPQADAVVTATANLPVGVLSADCGPVLFADGRAGVVGAAHAGWKGAVTGVLERTVEAMEALGADRSRIHAALGPTITAAHYEIGADRAEEIVAADRDAAPFLHSGVAADKRQFDLPALILHRLGRIGVQAGFVGRCTYGDEERFFSFRRTTHRGDADYGRQISAIALAG